MIRRARSDDIMPMVQLLKELFAIERDFEFDAARHYRGLLLMLGAPRDRPVWVATVDAQVVATCSAQVFVSTAEGGPAAIIEDVIVKDRYRGKGVARALLNQVENWARRRGIARMQLLADASNTPALQFYQHLDWGRTNLICLRRRLGNSGT